MQCLQSKVLGVVIYKCFGGIWLPLILLVAESELHNSLNTIYYTVEYWGDPIKHLGIDVMVGIVYQYSNHYEFNPCYFHKKWK
jgi:hypothetical protein